MSEKNATELAKEKSNFLRGTLLKSIQNPITGALYEDDTHLIKFHGSYQQADRDKDVERKKQKLEPLYSFMIRIRAAGGVATSKQWLVLDDLAKNYGSNTIKLTTRQAFQLHGILKRNLKTTIQEFNRILLDSISGCGDVNRNVMCNPNIYESELHEELHQITKSISEHLTPKTRAYYEIWLDEKLIEGGEPEQEPIYGSTYLPRKFKIGIALPPNNDVDVFSQDVGLIAIVDKKQIIGFNVTAGGGLGMTFGREDTYPRLGSVLGFIPKDKVIDVCEKIVTVQRDWGHRGDRRLTRLKYTIDKNGLPKFIAEVESRMNVKFLPPKPYIFLSNSDVYGWKKNSNENWNYTMYIHSGRVKDTEEMLLKTCLKEIAIALPDGEFRLTPNQNLIISNIETSKRKMVEDILQRYKVEPKSKLKLYSLACVALPTCTLAFAEAERYLPTLLDKIETELEKLELQDISIHIRMTGCPNGCARPSLAEIAFIGKSLGRYNLYLGGSRNGTRLNRLYKENLNEEEILHVLSPIFTQFKNERSKIESFSDFVYRMNYV